MELTKKHRAARIISLAIVGALTAATFMACSGPSSTNGGTTAVGTTANASASLAQTATAEIQPNIPITDYQGYGFRISTRDPNWYAQWGPRDIYAEAETGDSINDAVYARNTYIEDTYNVKITQVQSPSNQQADIKKSITAGTDDFDIVASSPVVTEIPLAQLGMFLDLNQVPNLELSQIWYDQNANAALSINHKLYFTISDLTIADKDATWVFLYDKQILQQNGLDDPYTLVANNQWTMDTMFSMSKAVSKDLDGDGVITPQADQYGLDSELSNTSNFFGASGNFIVTKDSSDLPKLSMYDNANAADVIDLAYQIQTNPSTFVSNSKQYASLQSTMFNSDGLQIQIFEQNRALFFFTSLNRVTMLRSANAAFGILPIPKYNASQTKYYANGDGATAFGEALCIPVTAKDVNRTTILSEALVAKSHYTLIPAYYDVTLKDKLTYDTQSGQMLDLIFANRSFDPCRAYGWGGLDSALMNLSDDGSNDMSSHYASLQTKTQTAIQQTIDKYNSISNN